MAGGTRCGGEALFIAELFGSPPANGSHLESSSPPHRPLSTSARGPETGIAAACEVRPAQDRRRIATISIDRPAMPTSRRITCHFNQMPATSFQFAGGASLLHAITVVLIG